MKKILLVLISAFLLAGCNRLDNHQPMTSQKLLFKTTDIIGQTFISHRSNLNIVSICLRDPLGTPTPLKFTLLDSSNKVIRSLNFNGANIENIDCTKFQFEPVAESKDQTYLVNISTEIDSSLTPLEVASLKQGLYIEAYDGEDYKGGEAYVGGIVSPHDLHFKTFYRQDLKSVFKESLSSFLTRLLDDPLFIIFFIILVVLVIRLYRKTT